MKTKIGLLLLALGITLMNVQAQRRVVTTTRAMSYDISDNLDLDAVASIFGDSENLEDFEYRLNDPENRISNLDLNQDGYIDYLRVVENASDRNSLVVIQAVLDEDIYQDVATIEIEKIQNGRLRVQIVGDAYIYGTNYIIEPVYVSTPIIFSFFWSSHYRPYYSPYYWNYYPRWYSYYSPYPTYKYHRHIYTHINTHHVYNHRTERFIKFSDDRYNRVRRNDYATRYPDRSFSKRQEGLTNKYELERRRPTSGKAASRNKSIEKSANSRSSEYSRGTSGTINERSGNKYETRRPSSTVNSGSNTSNRTRSGNDEINRGKVNTSNAPVEMKSGNSGSDRTRTRENTQVESNKKPDSPVQMNSGSRNGSGGEGSVNRNRTMPSSNSNRSGNQVDSRNSTPKEKSGSVISRNSRVNSEVKQSQQNTRKQESPKKEENKENGSGRRR